MDDGTHRTHHLLKYTAKAKAHAREQRAYPTINEDRMWQRLRGNKLGVHFRRQAPVAGYILDFLAVEAMLVVEVDGPSHETLRGQEYDRVRDKVLSDEGLLTLRFRDEEVSKNPEGVMERIVEEVTRRR